MYNAFVDIYPNSWAILFDGLCLPCIFSVADYGDSDPMCDNSWLSSESWLFDFTYIYVQTITFFRICKYRHWSYLRNADKHQEQIHESNKDAKDSSDYFMMLLCVVLLHRIVLNMLDGSPW